MTDISFTSKVTRTWRQHLQGYLPIRRLTYSEPDPTNLPRDLKQDVPSVSKRISFQDRTYLTHIISLSCRFGQYLGLMEMIPEVPVENLMLAMI